MPSSDSRDLACTRQSRAWRAFVSAFPAGATSRGARFSIPQTSRNIASSSSRRAHSQASKSMALSIHCRRRASYDAWYRDTPADFVFSVKGPRYVTHILRLKNIRKPLANFFASGLFNLREKLGPLLWQFPPSLRYDPAVFETFFSLLPRDTTGSTETGARAGSRMHGRSCLKIDAERPLRHAIEIRHPSFATPDSSRSCGVTGSRWWSPTPPGSGRTSKMPPATSCTCACMGTKSCTPVATPKPRSIDGHDAFAPGRAAASHAMPQRVAGRAKGIIARDVYCYFDNDVKVRAPFDADRLMQKLHVTRADPSFRFPAAPRAAEHPPGNSTAALPLAPRKTGLRRGAPG